MENRGWGKVKIGADGDGRCGEVERGGEKWRDVRGGRK